MKALGTACVTVDTTEDGIPACDIEVAPRYPANAAVMVKGDNAIMYGRLDPVVTRPYATVQGGQRDERIASDPTSGDRFFAVVFPIGSVSDVVAVTDDGTTASLRRQIDQLKPGD